MSQEGQVQNHTVSSRRLEGQARDPGDKFGNRGKSQIVGF